jgi:hypothetical protein
MQNGSIISTCNYCFVPLSKYEVIIMTDQHNALTIKSQNASMILSDNDTYRFNSHY